MPHAGTVSSVTTISASWQIVFKLYFFPFSFFSFHLYVNYVFIICQILMNKDVDTFLFNVYTRFFLIFRIKRVFNVLKYIFLMFLTSTVLRTWRMVWVGTPSRRQTTRDTSMQRERMNEWVKLSNLDTAIRLPINRLRSILVHTRRSKI